MDVIVTEPNHKNALAVCRALATNGLGVVVMGRRFSQANFSNSTGRSFNFRWERDDFVDKVLEIAGKSGAETLIPVGARSVFATNESREQIARKVDFAIGPAPSLALSKNKAELLEFAAGLGLEIPENERSSEYSSLVKSLKKFPLPFVVKSSSELSRFKPLYVRTKDDVKRVLREETLAAASAEGELILQRLIVGPGQGFFALYQDQKCKRVMMHQRLRETPETGGSSWAAKSIYSAPLFESGMLLLDALGWHGPAMVEFKVDSTTGKPYLIELNPKLWGSLDLCIASGVNIPLDLVKIASGKELEPDFTFERGVHFYWPLDSFKALLGRNELGKEKFLTNVKAADFSPHVIQLVQNLVMVMVDNLRGRAFFRMFYWVKTKGIRTALDRFVGEILGIPTKGACEVDDFLWLGAKPGALGRRSLRRGGRSDIISLVSTPLPDDYQTQFLLHKMPVTEFVAISPEVLLDYSDRLIDLENEGKRVYLHCREGVGRAPTLAIAFMIRKGLNLEESMAQISSARRPTSLTDLQLASLHGFVDFLKSAETGAFGNRRND